MKVHPLADVQSVNIGKDTTIWQFSVILKDAVIGENCNINCHTFIENDVVIGNNVTVKAGVFLWDGLTIKDNVFIGPNVSFTNDKYPKSKQYPAKFDRTILEYGASIGAAATILGGCKIGAFAMVGAGSLVTKDVPDRALVVGSPARIIAWLNPDGSKMIKKNNYFIDSNGNQWQLINDQIIML